MRFLHEEFTMLRRFGIYNIDLTQAYDKQKKRIEADANYVSTIPKNLEEERKENTELMRLVCDEKGNSLYAPRKSALLIRPSTIETDIGKMYQIKIAKKGFLYEEDEYPVWHIDDSTVMLLHNDGGLSLHERKQAEQGRLTYITHHSPEDFLGNPSLRPKMSNAMV